MKFLVLGDSHARRMPSRFMTSSYSLIIKSIPGLKFIDYHDKKLSLLHLLFSSKIQYLLSEADGIILLVGTNSVRIHSARTIISQIEAIIFFIRKVYPKFNQRESITIPLSFPCVKTTRKFSKKYALISNIQFYNYRLYQLSFELNFNTIDFRITSSQLAIDKMHIRRHYYYRIFNFLVKYLNNLIKN